jgi:pimeloyl-ACP methyl ester carboxylesterase
MLRFALSAAAVVAAGVAFAQEAPEGHRVEINGMQMYYEVSGEGEPMIVLHGSFMTIPMMGEIVGRLAETHRVYALEFQGHGRTTDIDRPITYPNLAGDVAAFMEAVGIEKADIFGYSMGAIAGLRLAIDHPEKVDQLVFASGVYDFQGWQPEFRETVPDWTVDMFTTTFLADAYREIAPDPEGFAAMAEKVIALEREPLAWGEEVAALETPVLIIAGDADGSTLEHNVEMFRLLGGGVMGDIGKPLPASRLAILPATSHTALIGQADLMMAFIGRFLAGEKPKGWFD